MKLSVDFEYKSEHYHYDLSTSNMDRNYADEPYVYWVREAFYNAETDEYEGHFEIVAWKEWLPTGTLSLSERGSVNVYRNNDDLDPECCIECKFEYVREC